MSINKTININEKLYENIKEEAKTEKVDLKEHVEDILYKHTKKKNLLNRIWSGLEVEKVTSDSVLLKNIEERKFYDVQIKDKALYCEQDRSKGCQHTSFVWLQVEDLDIPISK